MDLQRFKDKMQTEDALPLNILLDEAQNVVHKNGSMEVDAARELMQDIVDKFGIVKMISKDLRTGEMPVDDNPVKLTYNKVICIEELTELATAIIDYESYCSESDTDETVREHHVICIFIRIIHQPTQILLSITSLALLVFGFGLIGASICSFLFLKVEDKNIHTKGSTNHRSCNR